MNLMQIGRKTLMCVSFPLKSAGGLGRDGSKGKLTGHLDRRLPPHEQVAILDSLIRPPEAADC